jgi:hypothetical protein
VHDADGEVRQARQSLGQHTQHDTLAGTGIAVDESEAALAQMCLLDAPAEVLDFRGAVQRFGRYLRRERIELQPVEGQELRVPQSSCEWEIGTYAGGRPVAAYSAIICFRSGAMPED